MNDLDGTDVRARFDDLVGGLTAPLMLGPAAVTRGRALRRRRRAGIASGAAAVAAATLGAVTLALAGSDGQTAADPASHITTYRAVPGTHRPDSFTAYEWRQVPPAWQRYLSDDPDPSWEGQPARKLLRTLETLLPDDVHVVSAQLSLTMASGADGPALGTVSAVLGDDDGGRGAVDVGLRPPPRTTPAPGPDLVVVGEDGVPTVHVMQVGGTDGEPTAHDDVSVHDYGDITVVSAEHVVDRGSISIETANSDVLDEKWDSGVPVTAPAPLLTRAEVAALVESDAWAG